MRRYWGETKARSNNAPGVSLDTLIFREKLLKKIASRRKLTKV